uniref:ATP synthase subunit a n=1 Tax=Triaenodes qinglingensis TaxID=2904906 RepID=A0A9E8LPD2_9NEOP|nr:ATP synthase F0 subunit 6 [Triaenodes qinglingensis]UZZ44433.1 ATP synthase F0 subunit 6 [Triaenodes qinglingensis]
MMTNLFTTFDPLTNIFNMPLNWLSIMIGLSIIPLNFWLIPNRINILFNKISLSLFKEFKMLMKLDNLNGNSIIFISLFFYIFYNNFLGLMPYIFTATSHMAFTFTLSLTIWLTLMIFGWLNNYTHMMAHLIPNGTPLILTWFMVLIETTSNLIRPGTLAIRLMANLMAGHLLLTLLSEMNNKVNMMLMMMVIFTQVMLLILEASVSIIQAYVFFILTTLYSTEIN